MAGTNFAGASGGNIMLGRGKVFLDVLSVRNGIYTKTGELDIGNCTTFLITPKSDEKIKYESMDQANNVYARALINQNHTVKITGDEYSLFNIANSTLGDIMTLASTGGTVTGETLTAAPKPGAWYALAHRNVTVTAVHAASTTLVAGTDYQVDALTGRIYIVPTGAVTAAQTLTVDYTYSTYTYNGVTAGTKSAVDAFIRFLGDPAHGPKIELNIWQCTLSPNGDLGFLQDDFGNWTLEGLAIANSNLSPDGRPYQVLRLD